MREDKIQKKDKKWLERYGVSYSEVRDKVNSKENKNFGSYKKVINRNKKLKRQYVPQVILGIVMAIVAVAEAACLERVVSSLTIMDWHSAIYFSLLIGGAMILGRVLSHAYAVWTAGVRLKTSHNLRMEMLRAIVNTKASKFDSVGSGNVVNRVIGDANNFADTAMHMVDDINWILRSVLYLAYALFLNIWLGLILIAMGTYSYICERIYVTKFHKYNQRKNMIINDKMSTQQNETVRGIRDVKLLGVGNNLINRTRELSLQKNRASMDNTKVRQWYWNARRIGEAILLALFTVTGIWFIQMNWVTLSVLLVLMMYRTNITNFFTYLGNLLGHKQQADVYAERMLEILNDQDYPKEHFGKMELIQPRGEIEFKDITFSYNDKNNLFEELNLKIKSNSCVGFVGKSGEGKSTIVSLLPRLYEPTTGQILIDNINIADLTEDSLRKTVGVVQQTPYIFNMSIKENLLFAKADATDEELINVCKKAQIDDFIQTLPNKYDEVVGEGGITLSGGQRQRLAIARTLLQDNKVIVFDEATSALDNESQECIKQAIQELKKDKTILIVAHRLTTVKDCDKIFVLDQNKIVAEGTHTQLMKNCKVYQSLYKNEK